MRERTFLNHSSSSSRSFHPNEHYNTIDDVYDVSQATKSGRFWVNACTHTNKHTHSHKHTHFTKTIQSRCWVVPFGWALHFEQNRNRRNRKREHYTEHTRCKIGAKIGSPQSCANMFALCRCARALSTTHRTVVTCQLLSIPRYRRMPVFSVSSLGHTQANGNMYIMEYKI